MTTKDNTLEASLGEHINDFAQRVIQTRQTSINRAKDLEVTFNDVSVTVTIRSTVDTFLEEYEAERQRITTLYHNSKEYKEKQRQTDVKADNGVLKWNSLMSVVSALNLKDHNEVLKWLHQYCDTIDYIPSLEKEPKMGQSLVIVAALLIEGGYEVNANTGEKFKENDEENFARYIIGQVLTFLQRGSSVPPVFDTMYEQYKIKFKIAN